MKIQKVVQFVVIASCLFLSKAVSAAEESGKTRDAGAPTEVFDLSFSGGTVLEFVAQLEKAIDRNVRGGQKPNFVVPAEANSLKLPKLELRSVDVDTLMRTVSTLFVPQHSWQRVGGSTWVLLMRSDSRATRAFFVGHLLKKFKIEDVTTAIETMFEMGKPTNVDLKYHKDTQLLIIRAQAAQLESASEVLNQLRDAVAYESTGDAPDKVSKKR